VVGSRQRAGKERQASSRGVGECAPPHGTTVGRAPPRETFVPPRSPSSQASRVRCWQGQAVRRLSSSPSCTARYGVVWLAENHIVVAMLPQDCLTVHSAGERGQKPNDAMLPHPAVFSGRLWEISSGSSSSQHGDGPRQRPERGAEDGPRHAGFAVPAWFLLQRSDLAEADAERVGEESRGVAPVPKEDWLHHSCGCEVPGGAPLRPQQPLGKYLTGPLLLVKHPINLYDDDDDDDRRASRS
jgi:hypothetical protein